MANPVAADNRRRWGGCNALRVGPVPVMPRNVRDMTVKPNQEIEP
jgi:hypothetical protein